MKSPFLYRRILVIGVLVLFAGIYIACFYPDLSDFLKWYFIGLGLVLSVGSVIMLKRLKKALPGGFKKGKKRT